MTFRTCARLAGIIVLGAQFAVTTAHAEFPVGKRAPQFALKTPEGKRLSLSALRGKVVLVNFWGPS